MFSHPRRIVATACLALGVLGGAAARPRPSPLRQAGPLHVAARARRCANRGRLPQGPPGRRSRRVPFRNDRSDGQARGRVLRRAAQARRPAPCRCRDAWKRSRRTAACSPYPQAKIDGFEPGAVDADRTYFGSKLITTGIAVNTAAKNRPTSWADLARPDYKGQIAMPSPLYSGAAAIMLGTMTGGRTSAGATSRSSRPRTRSRCAATAR